MTDISEIVQKIKQKRELSGIDSSLVAESLERYLSKEGIVLNKLTKSQIKIVVKDVRSGLRENIGRFQSSSKDRYKLLEKNDIQSLLRTHSSTKERVDFYPQLKEIIARLKISSILDLGCGINPIALASPGVTYYASDINLEDLEIVKLFFQKHNLTGKVFACNLNNIENCSIPEADLCLVLKVFDILGKKDYETAKKVLEKVNSKHLIVSFSTRTLSGKPMNRPRRIWFEKLLDSLCYKFEIIKSNNEIFYIV